eukprot:6702523-Prymnesium_polylepis.1
MALLLVALVPSLLGNTPVRSLRALPVPTRHVSSRRQARPVPRRCVSAWLCCNADDADDAMPKSPRETLHSWSRHTDGRLCGTLDGRETWITTPSADVGAAPAGI